MYFTSLDNIHVTAWYDPDIDGMEVIKVKQDTQTGAINNSELAQL